MPWELNSIDFRKMSDLFEGRGFGRIVWDVNLKGGPDGSFVNVEVDIPMAYRADETIDTIRARSYGEVIAALRAAADRLAALPPPPLDRPAREASGEDLLP